MFSWEINYWNTASFSWGTSKEIFRTASEKKILAETGRKTCGGETTWTTLSIDIFNALRNYKRFNRKMFTKPGENHTNKFLERNGGI